MTDFKVGDRVMVAEGASYRTRVGTWDIDESGPAQIDSGPDGDGDFDVIFDSYGQIASVSPEFLTLIEDPVERPGHYKAGMPEGVEVIDIIRAQEAGYLHGNVIKYILRWKFKNGLEDLKKARVYLDWLIAQGEQND